MTQRVLAMLFIAVALVACSSNETGSGDGSAPRTIEVRMDDDLRFDPATIAVEPGETVRFELINEGEAVHEFLIGDEAAQAEFEEEMASGEVHHDTDAGMAVDPGQTDPSTTPSPIPAVSCWPAAMSPAITTAAWSPTSPSANSAIEAS